MHEAGKTVWRLNRSAGFSRLYRRVEQLVARQSHNLEVAGAKPASATISTYWGSDAYLTCHPQEMTAKAVDPQPQGGTSLKLNKSRIS